MLKADKGRRSLMNYWQKYAAPGNLNLNGESVWVCVWLQEWGVRVGGRGNACSHLQSRIIENVKTYCTKCTHTLSIHRTVAAHTVYVYIHTHGRCSVTHCAQETHTDKLWHKDGHIFAQIHMQLKDLNDIYEFFFCHSTLHFRYRSTPKSWITLPKQQLLKPTGKSIRINCNYKHKL